MHGTHATWVFSMHVMLIMCASLSTCLVDLSVSAHHATTAPPNLCGWDIAISSDSFPKLLQNNGTGGFTVTTLDGVGNDYSSITPVDIDIDGRADLIGSRRSAGILNTFTNTYGTFSGPVELNSISDPRGVAHGDINNDGFPDLVVASGSSSGSVYWYANQKNGSISSIPQPVVTSIGGIAHMVVVRDMNGDGVADIVVAASTSVIWCRNVDNGTSFVPTTVDTAASTVFGVTVGDINNDTHPDIVMLPYNSGTTAIEWYSNDGAGIFTSAHTLAGGSENVDGSVHDINGDGFKDLVVTSGVSVYVYLSNGATLTAASYSPLTITGSASTGEYIDTGDLDCDGYMDIIVGQRDGVYWFRNDNNTGFTEMPRIDSVVTSFGALFFSNGTRTSTSSPGSGPGGPGPEVDPGDDGGIDTLTLSAATAGGIIPLTLVAFFCYSRSSSPKGTDSKDTGKPGSNADVSVDVADSVDDVEADADHGRCALCLVLCCCKRRRKNSSTAEHQASLNLTSSSSRGGQMADPACGLPVQCRSMHNAEHIFARPKAPPDSWRRWDVFISHRGPDSKDLVAKPLKYLLDQTTNCTCFLDKDMVPGEDSHEAMRQAVYSCRLAIIIITPTYLDSPWCCREINAFITRQRENEKLTIFPIYSPASLLNDRSFRPIRTLTSVLETEGIGARMFLTLDIMPKLLHHLNPDEAQRYDKRALNQILNDYWNTAQSNHDTVPGALRQSSLQQFTD